MPRSINKLHAGSTTTASSKPNDPLRFLALTEAQLTELLTIPEVADLLRLPGEANPPLRFTPLTDAELTPVQPELLNIREVADLLRLSERSILRLKKTRLIPFVKLGGAVRFRIADVMRAIARRTVMEVS